MAKSVTKITDMEMKPANAHAAGIDIGSMLMMVSYTDNDGNLHLMEAGSSTEQLHLIAQTLQEAGVTDVAMEATGIYWMPLYEVLESYEMRVILINASHYRNVQAQKTDVKDSQWIHQLLTYGLLRHSHIVGDKYRELRDYLSSRSILQKNKSDTLNRIHKLLSQMNIKVQQLISDLEGVTGMILLRALASGEQDPEKLLSLIDVKRLKASPEDLLKSLESIHKRQHQILLNELLMDYDHYKMRMKRMEQYIEQVLKELIPSQGGMEAKHVAPKTTKARKNQFDFNLKGYLDQILGTDLTAIDGLEEASIAEIIAITGSDMSKWPTAGHFTSWLNLNPRPKVSGGKLLGQQRRYNNNQATQCFRLAAQSLWKNKGPLGQLYARLAVRKGSQKAIKAVARKIAVIFYHMLKNKTSYNPALVGQSEEQRAKRKLKLFETQARKHGYKLVSLIA
jgi:transposase